LINEYVIVCSLILYELLETEEEFVRELEFVMDSYYKEIEASLAFNKYRDLLFEDFKLIFLFHSTSVLFSLHFSFSSAFCMIFLVKLKLRIMMKLYT